MPAVSLNQKNSGSMVEENLEVTILSQSREKMLDTTKLDT